MSYFRFLTALLAIAVLSFQSEAGSVELISGERVSLSNPPRWTHSGAWASGGENLLLVDVLGDEVRVYDANGRFVADLNDDYARARGRENPTLVQNAGEGNVWIEYEDGYLIRLNERLQVQDAVNLEKAKRNDEKLITVFWWVPLGNSELLAFADVQRGEHVTGAVLRVPLSNPAAFEILQEVPISSAARRFFLTGQSYLASVQGKPYFLLMADSPEIVKPNGRRFRLVRVTKSGRQPLVRPDLPQRVTMETTQLLFQRLERAAAPAGIYGWEGFLYILMRTPAEGGRTIWSLMKIDPRTNEVLWNRGLDSSANHLVVVPGERYWAFVEKGPVEAAGKQQVFSILRVPARAIEN